MALPTSLLQIVRYSLEIEKAGISILCQYNHHCHLLYILSLSPHPPALTRFMFQAPIFHEGSTQAEFLVTMAE